MSNESWKDLFETLTPEQKRGMRESPYTGLVIIPLGGLSVLATKLHDISEILADLQPKVGISRNRAVISISFSVQDKSLESQRLVDAIHDTIADHYGLTIEERFTNITPYIEKEGGEIQKMTGQTTRSLYLVELVGRYSKLPPLPKLGHSTAVRPVRAFDF